MKRSAATRWPRCMLEPARNSPLLRMSPTMPRIRPSSRLLPSAVMTKQLDCWMTSRTIGSMVVIWVRAVKGPHQLWSRPSSTATVPSGSAQRSTPLAPTLAVPPAAPVTGPLAVALLDAAAQGDRAATAATPNCTETSPQLRLRRNMLA